jgi:hypothetical protein
MKSIEQVFTNHALRNICTGMALKKSSTRTENNDSMKLIQKEADRFQLKKNEAAQVGSTNSNSSLNKQGAHKVDAPGIGKPQCQDNGSIASFEKALMQEIQEINFQKIKSAWGSENGDKNFDASVDFDGNGTINILDWAGFHRTIREEFENLKKSWGAESGEKNYTSYFDYNSDGKININDWTGFIKKWIG